MYVFTLFLIVLLFDYLFFGCMIKSFTRDYLHKLPWLSSVLTLWLLPFLGWGQTTIVNYDFNSATSYPVAPVATATGVSSAATSSEAFTTYAGIASGTGAFTANTTAGVALGMGSSSGTNTKYFQFTLDGASLVKYSAFKLYLQGQRPASGAPTITLQYSVNGGAYSTFGTTYAPGYGSFAEGGFDLSSLVALNTPTSLSFRLYASGATGSGTLRIDNFQVQATNTVDPSISNLSPSTIEAGSPGFALAVGGSNFVSGAVVNYNGQDLATTYNSPTSLTAAMPAAAIATAGSYTITVTNPVAGSITSLPATFSVTPALLRWTGAGNSNSWFDPANWSTHALPSSTDDVLLDHRAVAASYTVSLDQNTAVSVKSLTVNPEVGDSIFVLVPASNTLTNALTIGDISNTNALALAIFSKGVVTNASGATAGAGIEVTGTGPTAFIYNGGSYRQASSTTHRLVVENLNTGAGTERGIFDFRLPATGTRSYAISVANRTYGTLILRNSPGATAISYPAGSANSFTVRGDLLIGPGVMFTPTVGSDMQVGGDIRVQGTMQVSNSTSTTTINRIALVGTKPQIISGTISLATGVGLVLNNPAGAVLATPLQLSGPLTLTNGVLTTTAANLLTLTNTASVNGGSNSSYINGPLARQTAAGPFSNLAFPIGTGASYRLVVLNATAQDATTYLMTQKVGPAADPTNFLTGTSALPTLTRVSRINSINITATPAANNFSGTVTVPFGLNDAVNQPNDVSFTIGKNSNGAGWQNIGNGGVTITTPATASTGAIGTITSQTFTSFSDFALASTSGDATVNPLPVTLISFAAVRQASGEVRVRWATASEQHSAQFEVQRSTDAITFATIATEVAHGTTSQTQAYSSIDGTASVSKLYYRLKEVDTDGSVQYSPVVALAATEAAATLQLYPNPAHDRLVIPAAVNQAVEVLDLAGRSLQTTVLPPSGELMVSELPAGTYLVRIVYDGQWRTFRFNKQ
jgi:hypothetical protein